MTPVPQTQERPVNFSSSHVSEPAANTAAAITLAAVASKRHWLYGVAWSYDAAPTGGSITVEDGSGTTVFVQSITAAGPDHVEFVRARRGSINTAMIVTLAAPGGATVLQQLRESYAAALSVKPLDQEHR